MVHDGPLSVGHHVWDDIYRADPGRIHLAVTPERKGQYGHPWRKWGIERASGQFIGLSNDDNYYAPVYFEALVSALQAKKADLAYCDMIHSHKQWQPMRSELKRGAIDAGNWIATASLVKETPWTDMSFAGDWTFVKAVSEKARRVVKAPGTLFVHN